MAAEATEHAERLRALIERCQDHPGVVGVVRNDVEVIVYSRFKHLALDLPAEVDGCPVVVKYHGPLAVNGADPDDI